MSENQQQVKVSKVGRKFAIGYQLGGEMTSDDWIEVISQYRDSILEIYFAMPGDMSGRAPVGLKLEGKKTDELFHCFSVIRPTSFCTERATVADGASRSDIQTKANSRHWPSGIILRSG